MVHLSAIAVLGGAAAQLTIPVWDGSLPPANGIHGNICNLAVVRGLENDRLNVRSGPGEHYQRTETLHDGDRVYVCNEGGEWLGVVFGRPGSPCGNDEPVGLEVSLTRPCASGWVYRRWIDIITG